MSFSPLTGGDLKKFALKFVAVIITVIAILALAVISITH
jgi:hypothetical protein